MSRVICIAVEGKSLVGVLCKATGAGFVVLEVMKLDDLPLAEAVGVLIGEWGGGPIRVALAGRETLLKRVATVKVKRAEWARVAEFETAQLSPASLDDVAWDWCGREDGEGLELLLAMAKAKKVAEWCEAAEACGSQIESITPAAIALVNAYRCNYAREAACILLLGWSAHATYLVWIAGDAIFVRTMSGGNAGIAMMAQTESARIAGEVARCGLMEEFPASMRTPRKVLVIGAPGENPEFFQCLKTDLKLPVEKLEVFQKIKGAGKLAEIGGLTATTVGILIGLAAQTVATSLSLNLLPREQKEMRAKQRRRRWLAAAVGLLLLACAIPTGFMFQTARRLEQRKESLEAALRPLRQAEKQRLTAAAALKQVRESEAKWRDWLKRKGAWAEFLGELQECLWRTEDAWLDYLQVERLLVQGKAVVRVEIRGHWVNAAGSPKGNGPAGKERMELLLEEIALCKNVAAVENERFEPAANGVLDFSCQILIEEGAML